MSFLGFGPPDQGLYFIGERRLVGANPEPFTSLEPNSMLIIGRDTTFGDRSLYERRYLR
jgi:hypothetical protein